MKKINILFLLCFLAITFVGCSYESGIVVGKRSVKTNNSISHKHVSSSQTITQNVSIKEGETADFSINVVTEEGEISIELLDDQGSSIYSGDSIPTSEFDIKVEEHGKYKFIVKTKKHKGSFDIQWNIKK